MNKRTELITCAICGRRESTDKMQDERKIKMYTRKKQKDNRTILKHAVCDNCRPRARTLNYIVTPPEVL